MPSNKSLDVQEVDEDDEEENGVEVLEQDQSVLKPGEGQILPGKTSKSNTLSDTSTTSTKPKPSTYNDGKIHIRGYSGVKSKRYYIK